MTICLIDLFWANQRNWQSSGDNTADIVLKENNLLVFPRYALFLLVFLHTFSSELCAVETCEILRFNCFILGYHRLTPFFLKRLLNIILYKSDESNYTLTPAINVFCIILRSADNNV